MQTRLICKLDVQLSIILRREKNPVRLSKLLLCRHFQGEWINLKGSSEVIKINHNFLHLLNLENPTEHFGKASQFILMWGKLEFSAEV